MSKMRDYIKYHVQHNLGPIRTVSKPFLDSREAIYLGLSGSVHADSKLAAGEEMLGGYIWDGNV